MNEDQLRKLLDEYAYGGYDDETTKRAKKTKEMLDEFPELIDPLLFIMDIHKQISDEQFNAWNSYEAVKHRSEEFALVVAALAAFFGMLAISSYIKLDWITGTLIYGILFISIQWAIKNLIAFIRTV